MKKVFSNVPFKVDLTVPLRTRVPAGKFPNSNLATQLSFIVMGLNRPLSKPFTSF
jgi:hypothetical protein